MALVVVPVIVVGLLEGSLRVLGFGYEPAFLIKSEHVWRDNVAFGWRFFPKALARASQPLSIPIKKQGAQKRVIVMGGSAAMGDPDPAIGMGRFLEAGFAQAGTPIEMINAAVTAINSHVVLPIARDCVPLDADAWILYLGNNEVNGPFGRGSVFGAQAPPLWLVRAGLEAKTWKLGQFAASVFSRQPSGVPKSWGGLEMFLQQQIREDDPALERVVASFERNLKDILTLAHGHGIPVLLGTVAVNLRDSPPFASLHSASLSAAVLSKWEAIYGKGKEQLLVGQWADALTLFDEAMVIDPDYAECHYARGRCLTGLQRPTEALEAYERALELDTLRFRATNQLNEVIRKVGKAFSDKGVKLVDVDADLRSLSEGGAPGRDFFFEHVHFTPKGNYTVASIFGPVLAEVLGVKLSEWPAAEPCQQWLGITPLHEKNLLQSMQARLQEAPFSNQLDGEGRQRLLRAELVTVQQAMTGARAKESVAALEAQLAVRPEDWLLRRQAAVVFESIGRMDEAVAQWREIVARIPQDPVSMYQLGALLNRLKRNSESETVLRQALTLRDDYPNAWNSLGIALSQQQKWTESSASFAKAVEYNPKYTEAYVNWGLVLAGQGERSQALVKYLQALAIDPGNVQVHQRLGEIYAQLADFEGAERHYAEVVRMLPNDANARFNFALSLIKRDKGELAKEQLKEAVRLNPNFQLAKEYLSKF